MSNQKLLQEAHDILDRSIRGDTQTGIFYNLQAIGYALVAIGNILDERQAPAPPANGHQAMAYATKQLLALQKQRDGLVDERDALKLENERLDAALEDAHILQECGHPRACIVHEGDLSWCEACVDVANAKR